MKQSHISEHERKAGFTRRFLLQSHIILGALKKNIENGFADKWYVCNSCGCLWEVVYPEFPAKGFVRKFSDGIYHERGY